MVEEVETAGRPASQIITMLTRRFQREACTTAVTRAAGVSHDVRCDSLRRLSVGPNRDSALRAATKIYVASLLMEGPIKVPRASRMHKTPAGQTLTERIARLHSNRVGDGRPRPAG
eukprot:scaffold106870_cov32-Tisochrysis_lutea.AAC.1